MKRILVRFSTVVVCLSLWACGSDSVEEPPPEGPAAFTAGTYPRFDPVASDIPFNTDLVFAAAATSDGTADVGAATDPVRAALNRLDGFSTSAFFDILVEGSVDPATVQPMQTVFLVAVNTGSGDALDPANIVGLGSPASFDTRVLSLDGGTNNTIRIRPTAPLAGKTKYLVFLTDGIRDAQGNPLTRSWTYNALRDPDYAVMAALVPVRNAILGWEQLAGGLLAHASGGQLTPAQAKERLVLTYTFTTTDPHAPLLAMAAPRAAIAGMQIQAGLPPAQAVENVSALDALGLLPRPRARSLGISPFTGVDMNTLSQGALAADVGKLYTGYIRIPYYQTAPDGLPFGEYLTRHWQPDHTLAGALGVDLPADVDGSYNVTYRYPFAEATTMESVPLQLTLPEADHVPGYAGPLSCGQIYAESGYPLVLYVHGITTDRSSGLILSHTLASRCVAMVAIDLPLHGVAATSQLVDVLNVERSQVFPFATLYGDNAPRERHFNVAGPGGSPAPMNFDEPGATDGSGAQLINLGYLINSRDNMRQVVMDLLNLSASLADISGEAEALGGVGLNLDRVYMVGMSLGGILGSVFAAVNEQAIQSDAQVGLVSDLTPLRGVVLTATGSQIAQILVNSATFGPVISDGLAGAGVMPESSNFERFMYVAQSALDLSDPVTFAGSLADMGMPVLVQQIGGDAVIPNSPESAPLAGTSGLTWLLGADMLEPGATALGQGVVRMTAGDHGSMLRPSADAPQVTTELQTQIVTFVLNDGEVVVGSAAPGDVASGWVMF